MILVMAIVLILFIGTFEISSYSVYGSIRIGDKTVPRWLEGGVRLNPYDSDIISKLDDEDNIQYISKTPFDLFCKWQVEYVEGGGFRVLRGTELHRKIEATHQQLLTQAKHTL